MPKGNPLLNKEVSSQSAEKEFLFLIKRKTVIQKKINAQEPGTNFRLSAENLSAIMKANLFFQLTV